MMKTILSAAFAIATMMALPSYAQEAEPETPPDFDAKMATIQFMNYMNYVVYTLSSYQNVFVIEEEYKNLSPGRLNLNRIPDETVLGAIERMLDTIHNMRAAEKDREWFKTKQDEDRQRRQQEILVGVLKNAAGMATDVAMQNWTAVASGVASSVGNTYSDWRELQRNLERENAENRFQYNQKKDDELHAQNKEQLRLQYNLVKEYGIEDRFRLSDENAKSLVEAVKSSDPKGVYTRLRSMKENQSAYEQFPMFWRHYAWFAFAAKDPEEALRACDHFDQINRHSLFRRDPMAAQVAMTRISAMIALDAVDADAVRRALETIKAYNYDGSDVDMAYFCASTYFSLLGDVKSAQKTLDTLLAVVEDRARGELRKYRDLFTEATEDSPWSAPPMMADMMRCHALQKAIKESMPDGNFRQDLESILERSTSSSVEKLFFMDPVRLSDLWEQGKADVVAIQLRREKKWNGDLFTAAVPVDWFALGDFPVSIDLLQGDKVVETIEEEYKDRIVRKVDCATTSKLTVRLKWKCPAKKLKSVDSLVLRLPNKSWPVAIRYLPPAGVDIEKGEFENDDTEYIPVSVDFMGKQFEIVNLDEYGAATIDALNGADVGIDTRSTWDKWTRDFIDNAIDQMRDGGSFVTAISFPNTLHSVNTNDVLSISAEGRDISVAWTNSTEISGTLELAVRAFNEFGATIATLTDEVDISPKVSGATTLKWPEGLSDVREPAILLLSAKKTKSLMQAGTEAAAKTKAFGGKISGKGKALVGQAGKWLKRDGKDADAEGEGDSDKAEK